MPACALCGTPTPLPYRPPPPEGSPDLDGRPGEPARSTLRRWVQSCAGCGACAPDLTTLPASAQDILPGEHYAELLSPFERWAALVTGTPDEAEALLQAAWLAEDDGLDSVTLRRRAAAAWPLQPEPKSLLRLADIQRRAGLLVEAGATLDRLPSHSGPDYGRIVAFERARIAVGDTGRQLLSSALRPPARTPHVSHGKPASGTLWQRLFGWAGR